MIWVAGRIVPDAELAISACDRTFEHGLGLFETLRTWNGRAALLDRHLARLTRSAGELGIPLDPAAVPDAAAVAALLQAEELGPDVMLRITLTGGFDETGGSTLWMRARPLPPGPPAEGVRITCGTWHVTRDDDLARHKSLNYWSRRRVHEAARARGFDEVISTTADSDRLFLEGSRTNLFLVIGNALVTPSLASGPMVPGIMRELVLSLASALPWLVRDEPIESSRLAEANEIFLTNSVRGIIPVGRANDATLPAPGPWTKRLTARLTDWLRSGGKVR